MRNINRTALLLCLAASCLYTAAVGQGTVSNLYSFASGSGQTPAGVTPTQGRDGGLYVTATLTTQGPPITDGNISRIRTTGAAFGLFSFQDFGGADGVNPYGGPVLARDGNYYGAAVAGGTLGGGTLYKISSSGVFTLLHSFDPTADGSFPFPPIQAANGKIYGLTLAGTGTMFQYDSTSGFSISTTFAADGSQGMNFGLLTQGLDGLLYAVASAGGKNGCGAITKLNTSGKVLSVVSFGCTVDNFSVQPAGRLLVASDGFLYGTTAYGGTVIKKHCAGLGCGTIFKLDSKSGVITTLHNFAGSPSDGGVPAGGLVEGTDGNFYGSTAYEGTSGAGILYQMTPGGQYTVLSNLTGKVCAQPDATMLQHTNGKFYGACEAGGTNSVGAIYSLDMGLGPFAALQQYQGRTGSIVQILGQGFTGTSGVTFNGVAATSFAVVSDTYMTAVVPTGATTGNVVVTTPTGKLTSNRAFTVNQ